MISKKVIITGSFGVGKTSLFNRFIYSKFEDKYLTTIGVKVNRKVVALGDHELTMLLWDIAGEVSQDKVPNSYFLGTSGIIYVFDLTRPITLQNLQNDINYLQQLIPGVTVKVVGNKRDLVTEENINDLFSRSDIKFDFLTSAKTGENVEDLFLNLGAELISDALSQT